MLPHAIANYEPYLYLRFFSTMPIIHCKCRSTEISIITFLLYILMIRLYHYACIFPILKIVTKSQIVHDNGIWSNHQALEGSVIYNQKHPATLVLWAHTIKTIPTIVTGTIVTIATKWQIVHDNGI